jgi:hypothetical protein|tara:strand:- start:3619 stop:4239 length:621 start_codon:yes stop_codon:yes gene_type:complete
MSGIEDLKSKLAQKNGMAMANQFAIGLPSLTEDMGGRDINVLCKSVDLPGKQLTTLDWNVGVYNEKVVNGFLMEDVNLTFIMLNDYGVKKYFDEWTSLMIDEERGNIAYKDQYQKKVTLHQLVKPQMRIGFDLGPLSIDFDILGSSIYSVELEDAFPTTLSAISLSNEADQLVEFSVQLSYTKWKVVKDERELIKPKISLDLGKYI